MSVGLSTDLAADQHRGEHRSLIVAFTSRPGLQGYGRELLTFKQGRAVAGEDSWEAGRRGATYGMLMPGRPSVGIKHYQEHAPEVAMDRAEVVSVSESEKVEVPAETFENCLKVQETTPLGRDEKEYKLYAPEVGLQVDEELRLVRFGFAEKQ